MKRFRATVYHLGSMSACVVGDEGIHRYITELDAIDVQDFKAQVRDQYIHDVDAEVSFGPISEVRR